MSKAVEIKLRAKQRTVEMVQEGQKKGDLAKQGHPKKGGNPATFYLQPASLKEVGLTQDNMKRWRPLARVTE